ncbi:MAG: MFS transporter [Clostridia bacterium]|nr:MFS transporter [Clostridia bacterium]
MAKSSFLHKIFGTVPGKGVQPKEAIAYSITGFGQNLICTIVGSYLTVFMTDALLMADATFGKLSGTVAVAILMLCTRVYDALNDPIMGSIVDRTRTKWGKCRPYLKWMALPIGLVTIACFLPVYNATARSFIIISVVYVIWSMVYTVADVPYWGLSTAMTNDTEVRGKILTVARIFCTMGGGLVTIVIPPICSAMTAKFKVDGVLDPQYSAQNAETLRWIYFIGTVIIIAVSMPMFFYGFKNTQERFTTDKVPPSLGHNIKLLFKNDQLLLIVISGILGAGRTVYMYTGSLYFLKYVVRNESYYSLLTMLVVPGGFIATILVPWFTSKFGKKKTYIIVHAIGAVTMFAMYFLGRNGRYADPTVLLILSIGFVILGIPQGINNVMTYAMIGDTVEYLEWKTDERAEGICFAMQTFINKIGMAVGAFVGVLAYYMSGISPSNPAGTISEAGSERLWAMLILTGAVSMVLTIIPMLFYKVTEKRQKEMVAEIEKRKLERL